MTSRIHTFIRVWRAEVFARSTFLIAAGITIAAPSTVVLAQSVDSPLATLRRSGSDAEEKNIAIWQDVLPEPVKKCRSADVCYDLHIQYVEGKIRNPNFPETDPQGYDKVKLRGYRGEVGKDGKAQQPRFMAPVVELIPGETFHLTLHNDLPKAEEMARALGFPWLAGPCSQAVTNHNQPHCANFNLTNMHTHGLHVSPSGNSDNVLLTIYPGDSFTYEYNVPKDHPAGTFWYHSHRHGSTAPQVASGMAGALIIRGDRQPELDAKGWSQAGDVDILLPRPGDENLPAGTSTFPERLMLFQQIIYACRNPDGTIKRDGTNGPYRCDVGDVGYVEPGPTNAFDQLGFGEWPASRRHTAINGEVNKTFGNAVAGQTERWRLIHGGIRRAIRLQLREASDPTAAAQLFARGLSETKGAEAINQVCNGETLDVVGLATDGLTRSVLDPRDQTWLQPGYREDILVTFPKKGTYCVLNAEVNAEDNVNATEGEVALLGLVNVDTGDREIDPSAIVQHTVDALVASARTMLMDKTVQAQVVADLQDGMKLSAFRPHIPVTEAEASGERQTLAFQFGGGAFDIGNIKDETSTGGQLSSDGAKPYEAATIDRTLRLGDAAEWELAAFGGAAHPFHIHVNPFEVIEVLRFRDPENPNIDPTKPETWIDVSGRGASSTSEYAGLKGAWKDTVMVVPDHLVRIRTRYERYIGDFVLHCHILDHEDQGMMQNVRIGTSDGKGGIATPMSEHKHQ